MKKTKKDKYQVVVIGGGHAGIEAACISAKLEKETLIITPSLEKIGAMHCNPSVGGSAKGTIVREIDSLGGVMGKAADQTALQFKMLNSSSGPAIQSLRVQSDKISYSEYMRDYVSSRENLEVLESFVEKLIIDDKGAVTGVLTSSGQTVLAEVVILTTGTYLRPLTYAGEQSKKEGPDGDKKITSVISEQLVEIGFNLKRFKTGTPPRIITKTIDFKECRVEPGSNLKLRFSRSSKFSNLIQFEQQLDCYLIYTNSETHKIIADNFHLSPICYKKDLGKGPRYCPSIEDKVRRFPDKEKHQIFLEPESLRLETTYLQGVSTSLPINIQEKLIRTLPGLKNCVVSKWGYAIEYDAIDSNQLKISLETKLVNNLFTAGQINGTSGYEEAAAQGLIAGINAVRKIENKEPFIIKRDEGYIGVLIDDLVIKTHDEPYRMLTSAAEYRLFLRHDNAHSRLSKIAYDNKLVSEKEWQKLFESEQLKKRIVSALKERRITRDEIMKRGGSRVKDNFKKITSVSLFDLIKNQIFSLKEFEDLISEIKTLSEEETREIEISAVYDAYLLRHRNEVKSLQESEQWLIPLDIEYDQIHNISLEAKEKLNKIRPSSLGQAARISGVKPTDLQVITFFLRKGRIKN